jgi:hypothetical protein
MLIAVICACALPEKPSVMSKLVRKREIKQRYCGSRLVDKIKEVCNSTYHAMEKKKRGMYFFHRGHYKIER